MNIMHPIDNTVSFIKTIVIFNLWIFSFRVWSPCSVVTTSSHLLRQPTTALTLPVVNLMTFTVALTLVLTTTAQVHTLTRMAKLDSAEDSVVASEITVASGGMVTDMASQLMGTPMGTGTPTATQSIMSQLLFTNIRSRKRRFCRSTTARWSLGVYDWRRKWRSCTIVRRLVRLFRCALLVITIRGRRAVICIAPRQLVTISIRISRPFTSLRYVNVMSFINS